MKSRLSSTIWTLVFATGAAFAVVVWLAYSAGRQSGGAALFEGSPGSSLTIFAVILALATVALVGWQLLSRMVGPVQELAEFSERLAAGDPRARAEVQSSDELGYIAENLNRAVARVSKANNNQEASDSLQRSITELLNVINQVA